MVSGVKGDFDFCQTAIKTIFNNKKLGDQLRDKYGVMLRYEGLVLEIIFHRMFFFSSFFCTELIFAIY